MPEVGRSGRYSPILVSPFFSKNPSISFSCGGEGWRDEGDARTYIYLTYICKYTHTHTKIHTYIHTFHIHTYIHTFHTYIYIYIYTYIYIYIYI